VTLPEVEGGEGTGLGEVVTDEPSDEAAVGGGMRRVEPWQVRSSVVQSEEVPVGLPRQPGERWARCAVRAGDAPVGHAERHGVGAVNDGGAVPHAGRE